MLELEVFSKNSTKTKIASDALKKVMSDFLVYMNVEGKIELELLFVGLDKMQSLNKAYRNIDKPTDVLSFPVQDPDDLKNPHDVIPQALGSIVICPLYAERKYKAALKQSMLSKELIQDILTTEDLCVHGLLHLLGYDHTKDKDYDRWEKIIKEFWVRHPRN